MRFAFLSILVSIANSSILDVSKDLLEKMTFSETNFVSSYYLMREIYLDSTMNEYFEYLERTFSITMENYYDAIQKYYDESAKECLLTVLNSNDIDYYAFFGSIITYPKYYLDSYAFGNFKITTQTPHKYESMRATFFDDFRRIIKRDILLQPVSKIEWQMRKELFSVVVMIMGKFPIKKGNYPRHYKKRVYPRCSQYLEYSYYNKRVDLREFVERITFVLENFEIESETNQPDIRAFVKLYYDLEYVISLNNSSSKKLEKKLRTLFNVYRAHLLNSGQYLEQYLYTLPIKLLCLLNKPCNYPEQSLSKRIRMDVGKNVGIALKIIEWAFFSRCKECTHLHLQILSERTKLRHRRCNLCVLELQAKMFKRLIIFTGRRGKNTDIK